MIYAASQNSNERGVIVQQIMAALPEDTREAIKDSAERLRNAVNRRALERGCRSTLGEIGAIELVLTLALKCDIPQQVRS